MVVSAGTVLCEGLAKPTLNLSSPWLIASGSLDSMPHAPITRGNRGSPGADAQRASTM